jgi:hypothetical protein
MAFALLVDKTAEITRAFLIPVTIIYERRATGGIGARRIH